MHIPQYWSIARLRHQTGKHHSHGLSVQRWGWSDSSEADAQRHAQQRAQQALDDLLQRRSGQNIAAAEGPAPERMEWRTEYGLDGEATPIREEVIERRASMVMTRNSYGARCLNVDNVAIADIDYPSPPKKTTFPFISLFFVWFFWLPICYLAFTDSAVVVFLSALFFDGVFGFIALRVFLHKLVQWRNSRAQIAAAISPVDIAVSWVHALSEAEPDWGLRLYETPKGLRVIVTHATWKPNAAEVQTLFQKLHADPLYAMLCERQQCFRARVSAKPWRMGLNGLSTQPRQWPTPAAHLPERQEWVQHYEAQNSQYAACRFITQLGSTFICPPARALIDWHDSACQAHSSLPLA